MDNPIAQVMERLSQGLPAEEPPAAAPVVNEPVVTTAAPIVQAPDKVEVLEGTIRDLSSKLDKLTELSLKPAALQETIVTEDDVVLDPDLEKAVDKRVNQKLKEAEEARERRTQQQTLTEKWDRKADTEDYPWLFNPKHPRYKPEHAAELKTEFANMLNKTAPDAVYNACARVASRIAAREVTAASQNLIRDASVRGSHTERATTVTTTVDVTGDLTTEQRYMAQRLGVSEDAYKKMHGQVRRNIH